MKKLLTLVLALVVVFGFSSTVFATTKTVGDFVEVNKTVFDSFATYKLPSNNSTTKLEDNVTFVASNKDGWYINVTAEEVAGTIEVAYKIGSKYFIVTHEINGIGQYWVGDGSGNQGVTQVKVGYFIETEDETWEFARFEYVYGDPGLYKEETGDTDTLRGTVKVYAVYISNFGAINEVLVTTERYEEALLQGDLGGNKKVPVEITISGTYEVVNGIEQEYTHTIVVTIDLKNRGPVYPKDEFGYRLINVDITVEEKIE